MIRHLIAAGTVAVLLGVPANAVQAQTPPMRTDAASQAGTVRHPHITWKGFRGIYLGQGLRAAARQAGKRLDVHCSYAGFMLNDVWITDYAANENRKVDALVNFNPRVRGPGGLRFGMTDAQAKAAMGPGVRVGSTYGQPFLFVHREGVGYLYASRTSDGPLPKHINRWGFALTKSVAKAHILNQGGC